MRKQHISMASLALSVLLCLPGCGKATGGNRTDESHANTSVTVGNSIVTGMAETVAPETAPTVTVATEPVVGEYNNENIPMIRLGETVTTSGEGAMVDGNTVTVTHAGTYLITGTAADAALVVDTQDTGKVTLIFNGASLTNPSGPALLVRSAPKKVVLYTAPGSVNLLADGTGYIVPDEEQVEGEIYPNACVYACDDLELDGAGTLQISGQADKGINTKDDLGVKGGTVTVTAAGVGIRANDSLTVDGGTVTVTAGGDGAKTANTEKDGKGHITIAGGALYITAKGDGLSAATDLAVNGGTLVITTTDTDGVVLPEVSTSGGVNPGGMGRARPGGPGGNFGGGPGMMPGESAPDKASISAKGLKAAGNLTVSGGHITVIAQDDGLHANDSIAVSGGALHIRSADDGMHANAALSISGGTTEIAQSYEGLEALHITVSGGHNRITASDDGANATDGSSSGFGGPGGGRPGGFGGASDTTLTRTDDQPCLTFAGGYTVFYASGDGIDSNGWIDMTGGTVLVYGPTDNGNGPIDFGDGGYNMSVSGGTFLAVGSSGMAESADNAGQAVLSAYWNGSGLAAGEHIGILDEGGTVLAAFELPKAISSIVFSSPALVAGESYTVVTGGTTAATVTDGVVDPATYTGYTEAGTVTAE